MVQVAGGYGDGDGFGRDVARALYWFYRAHAAGADVESDIAAMRRKATAADKARVKAWRDANVTPGLPMPVHAGIAKAAEGAGLRGRRVGLQGDLRIVR